MIKLKHKTEGYSATADDVRRNRNGEIIAVHIPIIGWKSAKEFKIDIEETKSNVDI